MFCRLWNRICPGQFLPFLSLSSIRVSVQYGPRKGLSAPSNGFVTLHSKSEPKCYRSKSTSPSSLGKGTGYLNKVSLYQQHYKLPAYRCPQQSTDELPLDIVMPGKKLICQELVGEVVPHIVPTIKELFFTADLKRRDLFP